jgi:hypothetical protein
MPLFKTSQNIFKDHGVLYDANVYDKPFLTLPPSPPWSYDRDMQIEDVDIWEVIVEQGGGHGVYASWCPYAEFYMIRYNHIIETFYQQKSDGEPVLPIVQRRLDELGMWYPGKKFKPEPIMWHPGAGKKPTEGLVLP